MRGAHSARWTGHALGLLDRDTRQRLFGAAASAMAYIFGIALLASPEKACTAAIMLLGIYLVVLGGLRIVRCGGGVAPNARSSWKRDKLIHPRPFPQRQQRNAFLRRSTC